MANSTNGKSAAKSRTVILGATIQATEPARTKEVTIPKLSPPTRRKKPPFPLWLHNATGQWGKKIKGHKYYFGTDRDQALAKYLWDKPHREAGREPPPFQPEETRLTIKKLGDNFLIHKEHQVQLGELTQRSFKDYWATCQRLADNLGKQTAVEALRPDDLLSYRHKLAETWGPNTLANEINRCRVVLRFAFEQGLIDRPVRFGEFKRPKKSAMRRRRDEVGPRMFEPAELHAVISAADVHLRAMIYLGINCGFGNADCGTLPMSAVDLDAGWVTFPRRKTGIKRRFPLWPETIAAFRASLAKRKKPENKDHDELVFVTKYGGPWYYDGVHGGPLSAEFRKLLDSLNVYLCKCGAKLIALEPPKDGKCQSCGKKLRKERSGLRRTGLSFYTLRHCFQTVADELGDYIATKLVMGHADNSISDNYRQRFPDERLRKVVDHIHDWLFGQPTAKTSENP